MTREEVIRIAAEAGIDYSFGMELERFADLVAASEREACAKVCDEADARFMRRSEGRLMTEAGADAYRSASSGALQCALAIRARSA